MKGFVFWLFQNHLPAFAAIVPPSLLVISGDWPGGFEQLAGGALSFIGVFLVFAVALDVSARIATSRAMYERQRDLIMFLLSFGTLFLFLWGIIAAVYFQGTILPLHMGYEYKDTHLKVVTPDVAEHKSKIFACVAMVIYLTGLAAAFISRRVAVRERIIGN